MTGLPCGEETMTIRQAVSMEYHNVTDRQIDGRTNGQTDRIAISISRVSVLIKAVSVSPCVKDSVIFKLSSYSSYLIVLCYIINRTDISDIFLYCI